VGINRKGNAMSVVTDLEKFLDEKLDKKAPVHLPANVRKTIAGALWWIALVIGVVNLWNAIDIWTWGHNSGASIVAIYAPAVHLSLFYYLALWGTTAVGLLALLASPRLKIMKKSGWDLLYYVILIESVPVILRLFSDAAGGIGSFFTWAVVTLAEALVLFQVRSYFTGERIVTHQVSDPEDAVKPAESADDTGEPDEEIDEDSDVEASELPEATPDDEEDEAEDAPSDDEDDEEEPKPAARRIATKTPAKAPHKRKAP
jgi:hypothetical protein